MKKSVFIILSFFILISTANAQNRTDETITVNGVSFKMIYVEGGTFMMGAAENMRALDNERPAHQVTLSNYWIGQTEVTQELWQAVMGSNPSKTKGNKFPVETVSWDDWQEFILRLNQLTGKNFRLPTEAEWEYAARGGSKSRGYEYSGSNTIDEVAWYDEGGLFKEVSSHVVGTKKANELGIYDMSGNVFEWCQDKWYNYDGSPTSEGSCIVFRGGDSGGDESVCRVTYRINYPPGARNSILGLRLAL